MDSAGFVDIVTGDCGVFDDFDDGRFARLLVVFNGFSYAKVETTTRDGLLELGEELVFENAVDEGVGLLWRADTQGKPIVFKSRRPNVFDGANRYCPFGSN